MLLIPDRTTFLQRLRWLLWGTPFLPNRTAMPHSLTFSGLIRSDADRIRPNVVPLGPHNVGLATDLIRERSDAAP